MNVRFSAKSDTGKRRTNNEDAYRVDAEQQIFAVCDGMGGHAAGEVASKTAVERACDEIASRLEFQSAAADDDPAFARDMLRGLEEAINRAGKAVYDLAQDDPAKRGMGTTMSLLVLLGSKAFIGQVGDSRVYLLREGRSHQLTEDHSLVNEMIRAGKITPEEADSVPYTNALTRALGVYPSVEVDSLEVDILPGDVFVLCSDGLHNYLRGEDILRLVTDAGPARAAEFLVDVANAKGGADNITVIVVQVTAVRETDQTRRIRLTLDTLGEIPLFHHLSYAERVRVLNACEMQRVPAGDYIIQEGEEGDAFYVLIEGSAAVQAEDRDVAVLGPGRHFGEMSLVDARPRSASILTLEECSIIRVARADFYDMVRQDSVLGVKLLWNMVQTLSQLVRDRNEDAEGSLPLLFEQSSSEVPAPPTDRDE